MATLLREVGGDPNATLILGYVEGTEDEPYNLVTANKLEELAASGRRSLDGTSVTVDGHVYYARLKDTFSPSSWFVFDYDEPPKMPDHLKAHDFTRWLRLLDTVHPMMGSVAYVALPSSSSRIIDNGIRTSSANKHMLVQAADANDVERFGKMLFLHALKQGLGFTSTTKGGAKRRQTIFDPTTFSRERLLFEGKPVVVGEGLSVGPVQVEAVEGARLDTSLVESITEKIDGLEVGRSSGGYLTYDYESLTSDVEIETKDHGTMTIVDYVEGDFGKIRAQSPFRASESLAAYLNMHKTSESAFLFDVGSQTKYLFSPSANELFASVEKNPIPTPPAPPMLPRVPAPPTALAINVEKFPAPIPPVLSIVAGTDIDNKGEALEKKFEATIAEMRRTGPGTPEKIELVEKVLTIVESLGPEEVARQIRWRQEVASASELLATELKEITKAVKNKLKRTGKVDDTTPPHRRPLFGWPDVSSDDMPVGTIENARFMFHRLGVQCRYNSMSKDMDIAIPWASLSRHSALNDAFSEIKSISRQNKLSAEDMIEYARRISNGASFNPVSNWVESKAWDGVERFEVLLDSMDCTNKNLGRILLRRWMISAIAALYKPNGVSSQGVLVLQGPQGAGKTTWLKSLCGDNDEFFKDGHHLDLRDKDTLILALSNWLVELGELDSMFKSKRQVEELKAFITSNEDELRRPYERAAGRWARRTVFCASVNPEQFLVDNTGDRRYWTLSVTRPRYMDMPDMQQVWAEVKTWYDEGEQIHLNPAEMAVLNANNSSHKEVSVLEDRVRTHYDWEHGARGSLKNAVQVLKAIGVINPTKTDRDDVERALKEIVGDSQSRVGNRKAWRMPTLRIDL
ncbi:MAG: VapE domain-containing protein [Thermodesulfobacteriota bacterium]